MIRGSTTIYLSCSHLEWLDFKRLTKEFGKGASPELSEYVRQRVEALRLVESKALRGGNAPADGRETP